MIESIRNEFHALTRTERLFILFALLCSFFIQADYATIRPVSNALFISSYGYDVFPYAWLATVPLNFLLISWYNKNLPRWGCFKTFLIIISAIAGFNLFCALFLKKIAWLPFVFYVWKEVYIMLMFQQLWSVIHSTIAYSKAKYLYGIIFGIGACGAIAGSMLPGFFAVQLGSENLLFATLPIYLLLGICYAYALKNTQDGLAFKLEDQTERSSMNAFIHGFSLIRSSSFLLFILLIVVLMQVSSTLIDYQFNHFLQENIPEKDLRTQYTGRVLGLVHAATLALQFFGSFLFVHFLGVKRSHFFIPFILGLNNLAFIFMPTFGLITFSYITVKCFDFSLFGIVKEMMYIPLKKDEKFRAKAFIDVFAYRTSKACASFLIFGLQWFLDSDLRLTISSIGLTLFVLWCYLVKKLLKSEPVHV
jgi:ATP:ADP antiporter, AAA family